ncbi:hypothetical protein APY03_7134 [Variovorax sp. WDL1]|nr:hypothetical protein APY03_7134 [Variovorax sp. WDL1]
MILPTCPSTLPADLSALVAQFGAGWAASPARPSPTPGVLQLWSRLVQQWADAPDVPLLVRKHRGDRGTIIPHATGRTIIPSDNSAAHWAFSLAAAGICPSLAEVRDLFAEDKIPVVMIQKAQEKQCASHHCRLVSEHDVTEKGWKLAHIEPVGVNTRTPLACIPLETLKSKFINLVSPANMFVIPRDWGGLAESPAVIDAVKAWNADGVLRSVGRREDAARVVRGMAGAISTA